MGFLKTLKKAFGFESDTDDELEIEGIDATVTPLRQRSRQSADRTAMADSRQATSDSDAEKAVAYKPTAAKSANEASAEAGISAQPDPSVIFEQVIEVFNRALPDFLGQSVDPERERQVLFKALDSSMKDYFENLEKNVERRLQIKFEVDRQRLHEQIEELQVKARKEEEGTSNAKNLQLSAERQKRALSERVHDLEKQIATLEAENEQYILENKSMANKLRLASMTDRDAESGASDQQLLALQQQVDDAQKQIAEAEKRANDAAKLTKDAEQRANDAEQRANSAEQKIESAEQRANDAEKRAENAEKRADDAEKQVAAAESLLHDAAQETEASANAAKEEATAQAGKLSELQAEINRLENALEQAKAQDALGRAMVNDLNGRAAEARKVADEKSQQVETMRTQLQSANEQLTTVSNRLAKAQEDLKVVREVQEQVFKLEEKQKNSDATLRRQKDELMEMEELLKIKDADLLTKNTTLRVKDETIRRLEDQTDSLRKTVENIQYEKTQSESALLSEIERLKSIKGLPATVANPASYANIQVVNGNDRPATNGRQPASQAPASSIVEEPPMEAGVELTLDLPDLSNDLMPDLMLDQPDTVQPKPRRGRPPKQKVNDDAPAAPKTSRKTAEEDDSALSLLDNTDWLISTPPAEAAPKSRRQRKQKADSDDDSFGYKEPQRQEPPDNPAQMLLW